MATKEYFKEYYQTNKKKIDAYRDRWQVKNIDRVREKMRKWSQTPKGMYKILKRRQVTHGRKVLSQAEFLKWYDLVPKRCVYCRTEAREIKPLKVNGKMVNRLTIERLDNKRGYEPKNMELACALCNHIRSDILSIEEMKLLAPMVKQIWLKK